MAVTDRLPDQLVSISVVSHGQGRLIAPLLDDLYRRPPDIPFELILTLNIPEDEGFIAPFRHQGMKVIRNASAKGFGANHNAAFAESVGPWFAVVNPDIRIAEPRLAPLLETLAMPQVAACAPEVRSPTGGLEENARKFPTVRKLFRKALGQRQTMDYRWDSAPVAVDWVAGMFVVFRRDAFEAVGGFDERYFMYYEDADVCARLRDRGWQIFLDPRFVVVHDAQRRSHRDFRHMRWHLQSMARFLASRLLG